MSDWLIRPSLQQARLLATLRGARGLPVPDPELFACLYPGETPPHPMLVRLRLAQVACRTRVKLAPGLAIHRPRGGYCLSDQRDRGPAWWCLLAAGPLPCPAP
jgi:hypothetical protein